MVARTKTMQLTKSPLPNNAATGNNALPPPPPPSPPAAKAANTSGAPLPNAKSVTPAKDSEQPNFSDIASKAGDRY